MCTHTKTYIHTHKHTYTHKPKHTYIHPKHTSTHTHTHHIYTVPHTQVKHAHRSISTHNHKFIIDIKPISMQSLCTIRYVPFSRPLRIFLNYLIIANFPKETKLFLKINRYFNKLNVKLGRTLLGFNK